MKSAYKIINEFVDVTQERRLEDDGHPSRVSLPQEVAAAERGLPRGCRKRTLHYFHPKQHVRP